MSNANSMSKSGTAGLTLENDAHLGVFNETLLFVVKFFVIHNWFYSLMVLTYIGLAVVIFRQCGKADLRIDAKTSPGPVEQILKKITMEVDRSCTNTLWTLGIAVTVMLVPVLINANSDTKTQAVLGVLGFLPGYAIGVAQLYSAYKIIQYVLSRIPVSSTFAGNRSSSQKPKRGR
jgi:hypothetical protein